LEGTETILLIEDEELIPEFLVAVFQKNGYNVLPASDGEEGFAEFSAHSSIIDIVISDYGLLKINGIELFRLMKNHSPSVKTILMSRNISNEIQREAESLGVAGFIHKPFEMDAMLKKIRTLLPIQHSG
jgi:DNA-binding response OmpR family regulator